MYTKLASTHRIDNLGMTTELYYVTIAILLIA